MDRFIAIGVGQGDAFFLERGDKCILVDGGKSKTRFPRLFRESTSLTEIDIIVCTHADADHVNGLVGFFESGMKCQELWLPGTWTDRLRDLLLNPTKLIREVSNDIDDGIADDFPSLDELGRSLSEREDYPVEEIDRNTEISFEDLLEITEEVHFDVEFQVLEDPNGISIFPESSSWNPNNRNHNLLIDAIDTAKRIRKLALLALKSQTKLRWFQFDNQNCVSGGEQFLKPVNSYEIFQMSRSYPSALFYLALSVANRESLVFYSPSSKRSSGVLFSADSDFSFKQLLPKLECDSIVTAPHHGSEHNRNAYLRLAARGLVSKKSFYVRSDSRSRTSNRNSRPGKSYLRLKAMKCCTICRHPLASKQDVRFNSSGKGWSKAKGIAWCHCE